MPIRALAAGGIPRYGSGVYGHGSRGERPSATVDRSVHREVWRSHPLVRRRTSGNGGVADHCLVQWKHMDTPPVSVGLKVMLGGALILGTGILIGNA